MSVYTISEVKKHSTQGDCWIIINKKVYDLSKYMELHPGGAGILLENSEGKDATEEYEKADHTKRAQQMLKDYLIGELANDEVVEVKIVQNEESPTDI